MGSEIDGEVQVCQRGRRQGKNNHAQQIAIVVIDAAGDLNCHLVGDPAAYRLADKNSIEPTVKVDAKVLAVT
ncbi:MAG TPA: hypothetical protein VMU69_16165 [Bradyrhizobium sp.]|nr:hypothetical protein [Bradyrhizobium sp.]